MLRGFAAWAFRFLVIGANALLAYMLDAVFYLAIRGSLGASLAGRAFRRPTRICWSDGCEVVLLWLILWWLYRRRLFLRA